MSNCIDCLNLKVLNKLVNCNKRFIHETPLENYTKKGTPAEWKIANDCPFFSDMEGK